MTPSWHTQGETIDATLIELQSEYVKLKKKTKKLAQTETELQNRLDVLRRKQKASQAMAQRVKSIGVRTEKNYRTQYVIIAAFLGILFGLSF